MPAARHALAGWVAFLAQTARTCVQFMGCCAARARAAARMLARCRVGGSGCDAERATACAWGAPGLAAAHTSHGAHGAICAAAAAAACATQERTSTCSMNPGVAMLASPSLPLLHAQPTPSSPAPCTRVRGGVCVRSEMIGTAAFPCRVPPQNLQTGCRGQLELWAGERREASARTHAPHCERCRSSR